MRFAAAVTWTVAGIALAAWPRVADAEEPAAGAWILETAQGSIFKGTCAADSAIVLVTREGERRVPLAGVHQVRISAMRADAAARLETAVRALADAWRSEDVAARTRATDESRTLPPEASPALTALLADADPEVVVRAREALEVLRGRGVLLDPRDLVQADGETFRGWAKGGDLTLATALGPVTVSWTDVVLLRRADRQVLADPADFRPPPAPRTDPPAGAQGRRAVVVELGDGMRLVGEIAAGGLRVVVGHGTRIAGEDLVTVARQPGQGDPFRVVFAAQIATRGRVEGEILTMECCGQTWRVPVKDFASADFRPFRRGDRLSDLVAAHVQARAAGVICPDQRFWAHIRDQRANPWDSPAERGMTWTLHDVKGDVCLVGSDTITNPYQGDTPLDAELPILCIRKTGAAPPEGLDVSDPYRGWGGGEIRLSRPVKGTLLTSLDEANRRVKEEFGEEWRIAQHHDTTTLGWHWWAYWKER